MNSIIDEKKYSELIKTYETMIQITRAFKLPLSNKLKI